MSTTTAPAFVSVNRLAQETGLGTALLRREAEKGLIPALRVGKNQFRFNVDDVLAALRERAKQRVTESA